MKAKSRLAATFLLALAGALPVQSAQVIDAAAPSEPAASAVPAADEAGIAGHVYAALGGPALEAARTLRFDFESEIAGKKSVRVRHLWDRPTGNYRMEWADPQMGPVIVLMNVNDRSLRLFINGQEQKGALAAEARDKAFAYYTEQTFVLLLPFQLRDPGVRVAEEGTVKVKDRTYDLLHVTFDSGHPRAGEHYWLYVDPETRRIDRSAFWPKEGKGKATLVNAAYWNWEAWMDEKGVFFSQQRTRGGKKGDRITFPVISLPLVDPRVYDDPSRPMPE